MKTVNIANLDNQERILELAQMIYASLCSPEDSDWETYFKSRQTGELFSTKFYNYSITTSGEGEFLNDSTGKVCVPSTDKVKNQDDFENHNAFWYVLCNFAVDDNGMKIPTAIEGQPEFSRTGKVDVGVLTPPLYWGEEQTEDGYIKHFSDSEHPKSRSDLTLTLMPHCRDNKGKPMPYGIVPVYYAGYIDGVLYGSSGLPVGNFMSYEKLHTECQKKGIGWQGAGSERGAYLRNFLWIKYKTLNSQKYFQGCTSYDYQYANLVAENNVNYVTLTKAQANDFYFGGTVSIGEKGANSSDDRVQDYMHNLANMVNIAKIEDVDGTNSRVYVDAEPFNTTTTTYISSMPLRSGQTDDVLGNDGYIATGEKYSFKIQGVEDGIGAWNVSSNEVMYKETATLTKFYARNGADYSNVLGTIQSNWKYCGEFKKEDHADFWIGETTTDLETGVEIPKTVGSGSGVGFGDYFTFGSINKGLRECLSRGHLKNGEVAGLTCVYSSSELNVLNCFIAGCVS